MLTNVFFISANVLICEFVYLYLAHGKDNGIELINSQLTTNKNELKGSSLISFISISDTTTTAKPSGKL